MSGIVPVVWEAQPQRHNRPSAGEFHPQLRRIGDESVVSLPDTALHDRGTRSRNYSIGHWLGHQPQAMAYASVEDVGPIVAQKVTSRGVVILVLGYSEL